ncbi:MAG TPA: Bax inhibitor-1 family protein [Sandaracinaceae bacterium]
MRYDANPWAPNAVVAADADVDERAAFITKTYLHLVGAIFAFVVLEAALFVTGVEELLVPYMLGGRGAWAIVLLAFIGVSWIADRWARNATSLSMQYVGLGLYVLAEAVIFLPMIAIALHYAPKAIPSAALVTLVVFGGLTGIVFLTRKDFSFLRGILGVGALGALALIGCSLLFGFNLGVIFSVAMVVLASGCILYNTSNVLHHYRTDQYVSAALTLFADVALLFWYVLRIFLNRR